MTIEEEFKGVIIRSFRWIEERGDWEVDYIDSRNGTEQGRRYLSLPITSNEQDIIDSITNERE